jgi:DNA excision repair protein ERCC-6
VISLLVSRIDGDVLKPAERQRLISEFNADATIDCFLLTTQTGGFGISLTGADRVIIFDPHWNPSADDQVRQCAHVPDLIME